MDALAALVDVLADARVSYGLGLATPLTAVCVIPLYPGFLAFLSNQDESAPSVARLGALVAVGTVGVMALLGLVFTTVLQASLTGVVDVVSPVAFAVLAVFSVVLIAGSHPQSRLPTVEPPQTSHPSLSALCYGAFFGAVVLPCNPGFISAFFSRILLFADPVASLAQFLAFGLGMATPLLAFAVVSEPWRDRVLGFLTRHRREVNVASGLVMLGISLYYLFGVFAVHESLPLLASSPATAQGLSASAGPVGLAVGSRTLVALGRPDGRYDLHRSQWGGEHVDRLAALLRTGEAPPELVDPDPLQTDVAVDAVLDTLDPREYEAFVAADEVPRAYLVCRLAPETVSDRQSDPTHSAALVPYSGEDGARRVQRFCRTTKDVLGDAVDAGLLSPEAAETYLALRLVRHPDTPDDPDAIIWVDHDGGEHR